MPQPARTETLAKFKSGEITLLVCSDVAARGLDIPDMSHVINFDVPIHAEDYVHRIGRTGRAGRQGHAFTIATAEDSKYLAAIKEMSGNEIPRHDLDGNAMVSPKSVDKGAPKGERGSAGRGRQNNKPAKSPEGSIPEAITPVAATPAVAATEPPPAAPIVAEAIKTDPVKKPNSTKKEGRPRADKAPVREKSKQSNAPVKGLGDHMPAFLMASAPKRKAK
jgi:superfamily II DNA/RNA helicase